MAPDDAVDYSQGLPTPAVGGLGSGEILEVIKSAWPIGLIALGVVVLSYVSGTLEGAGLSGLNGPRRRRKTSKKAAAFLHHKIRTIIKEGKPQSQAIRIAFEMARKSGYKVPPAPAK